MATIGNIDVCEKLRILSQLWKSGIKAETLYLEKPRPNKQMEHALKNFIPAVLWIGEEELKNKQLKLKVYFL